MISDRLKRLGNAFVTLKLLITDKDIRKALFENVRNCVVSVAVLAVVGTYIKLHLFIKTPGSVDWIVAGLTVPLATLTLLLLIANIGHFFDEIWRPMHLYFCKYYCDNFERKERRFLEWTVERPHSFTIVTILLLIVINSTIILLPAGLFYNHLLESYKEHNSKPLPDQRIVTILQQACATQPLQTSNCADLTFSQGISETQQFNCSASIKLSLTQNIYPQFRPSILLSWDKNNIYLTPSPKTQNSYLANHGNLTWSETSAGWTLADKNLPNLLLQSCIKQP